MAGETLSGPFLLKRGETAKVAAYTGPAGELVIDLGKKTVAVQDGSVAGGHLLVTEHRTVTPGAGLKINGGTTAVDLSADLTITLDQANIIAANDKLLKTDANGKIASDLSMSYTAATGVLNIVGQDGSTVVATATIPSAVSALSTAELVTNPSGQPAGTYLHFVFTLSTGATSDVYVNVTSLIDIYTVSNAGVVISGYTIGAQVSATNPGLEIKNDGLAVKLSSDTGNQLQFDQAGALLVPAAAQVTVVSSDTGNIITAGTDDGALLKLAASNNAAQLDAKGALIVPLDCGVLA